MAAPPAPAPAPVPPAPAPAPPAPAAPQLFENPPARDVDLRGGVIDAERTDHAASWQSDANATASIGCARVLLAISRTRSQGWTPTIVVRRILEANRTSNYALLLVSKHIASPAGRRVAGFLVQRTTEGWVPPNMPPESRYGFYCFTRRKTVPMSGEQYILLREDALRRINASSPHDSDWSDRVVLVRREPRINVAPPPPPVVDAEPDSDEDDSETSDDSADDDDDDDTDDDPALDV